MSPTPAGYVEPFNLTSGGFYGCGVISDANGLPGSCITDGPGGYGLNERCTFTAVRSMHLMVIAFETGASDGITVNGRNYGGDISQVGPMLDGMAVTEGATIEWQSNQPIHRRRRGTDDTSNDVDDYVDDTTNDVDDYVDDTTNDVGTTNDNYNDNYNNNGNFNDNYNPPTPPSQHSGFILCAVANDSMSLPPTPAPASLSPTPAGYVYPFVVTNGSEYGCSLTNGGGGPLACFTDGPGDYSNNERCTFTVQRDVRLLVVSFDTQVHWDRLIFDEDKWVTGDTASAGAFLDGMLVTAGSVIRWQSDSNNADPYSGQTIAYAGFVVCAVANGTEFTLPPAQTPPPTPYGYIEPFALLPGTTNTGCDVVSRVTLDGVEYTEAGRDSCITNWGYSNNEVCTFAVRTSIQLLVFVFDTQEGSDFLNVNGIGYSGSISENKPLLDGMRVAAGTNITWRSDGSNGYVDNDGFLYTGFTVCAVANGTGFTIAPTSQPPTYSPTATPTVRRTNPPTGVPTLVPTAVPTVNPTATPTASPTGAPIATPTASPTFTPTAAPTRPWCEDHAHCDPVSMICQDLMAGAHLCICKEGYLKIANDSTRCDAPIASSSSSFPVTTAEIGGGVGIVAAMLLVGLVYLRVRQSRRNKAKSGPTDFAAMRERMFEDVGFGLQPSISRSELGLVLMLDRLPNCYKSGQTALSAAFVDEVAVSLGHALTSKSSDRPAPHVNWQSASVQLVATDPPEVSVVVQRSQDGSDPAFSDTVLSFVTHAVELDEMRIADTDDDGFECSIRVQSAALMLPQMVPREMHRSEVQRLGKLGSGSEAVVWRAQVVEKDVCTPPFSVALKEPRESGGMTREDIEREATMMALLAHSNVVKLVGVVTSPRHLPTMLVIEYCEGGAVDEYLRERYGTPESPSTVIRLSFCADIAAGLGYLASRRVVHRDVAARNVSTCLLQCSGKH